MAIKIDRREVFKTAAYVGAGLLLAGYIRYSMQDVLGTFNGGLMIAGGVLLIASVVANFKAIRAATGTRSARLGANTTAMGVGVIAILAALNFLGYKHHSRIDVTSEQLYSLSEQSKKIASSLSQDVKVIRFDKTPDVRTRDLITEYRNVTGRITFEETDPQEKPLLANQYKIENFGDIVVVSGNRNERVKDASEQAITNAILKVTRDTLKTICFVEGHGEKKLSSREADGYGSIEEALKNENYQVKTMNLVTENQVPSDCAVLVVVGPKQSFLSQEAAMIGKYLDAGGKAELLLDPETEPGLDDVLKAWNVELGNDVVIDSSGLGRLFGAGPEIPLARPSASHQITRDLETSAVFFPLARSVSARSGGSVSPTEILETTDRSWAEVDIEALKKGGEVRLDEGKDKRGPVSIGVAASNTAGDKEARLVVIGDSDFAANGNLRVGANRDLFLNSINWLAQDEDLISIRPKSPTERAITMTESEQGFLPWLAMLIVPGALVGSGILVWLARR